MIHADFALSHARRQTAPLRVEDPKKSQREKRKVILAASLGTIFEWYDFYLYGALAPVISRQFFSGVNDNAAFVFALLAFAAGFAVRPLGALVFGRLGDLIGRRYTFLVTLLIMGLSTAIVGLMPTYAQIGIISPIALVVLRILQGLALGGEYGGAATYVAEHAPPHRRGLYTSFIQATATLGLLLALLVILGCRSLLGREFEEWGWRLPFLVSILLLLFSIYIRLQLNESPVFRKLRDRGQVSKAPLTESFARWKNLRVVILVMLGGTAGQAVVWYTGHFYALFFMQQALKLDAQTSNLLMAGALVLGAPFYLVFGALSDRIGRKPIIMTGCILAALTYFPIFKALTVHANPVIFKAQQDKPVVLLTHPGDCTLQFDPVGHTHFVNACDIARSWLAKKSIPYLNADAEADAPVEIRIGRLLVPSFSGEGLSPELFNQRYAEFDRSMLAAVVTAGYPARADAAKVNVPVVLALLTLMVIYVSMVYGPMAAWLVELFPARIRYTSLSMAYHVGNGWFGGFLPTIAFAMVAQTGDIYFGLWYPVAVAGLTALGGTLFLPETKDRDIQSP